ncbi:type II secretion system F family protein [Streptomyces sp. NPDC004031]
MTGLLLWVLTGLAVTGGAVGVVAGLVGTTAPARASLWERLRARGGHADADARMRGRARITAGAVAGAAVWLVTGVFVGGALVALVIAGVPWLLAPTKSTTARIAKLEALGDWTLRLSSVLRLGRGLDEALQLSRRGVPEAIAGEVGDLVDRLQAGWRPVDALEKFGDAMDDVTADKIVAALMLSASDRGPGLAQALEDLAGSVHDEVTKRRNIEADRAKSRTTVRWMVFITLGLVGVGFLVTGYTHPYALLLGQLVLALLTGAFVAVLVWMRQLASHRPVARFLVRDPRSRAAVPGGPSSGEDEQLEVGV